MSEYEKLIKQLKEQEEKNSSKGDIVNTDTEKGLAALGGCLLIFVLLSLAPMAYVVQGWMVASIYNQWAPYLVSTLELAIPLVMTWKAGLAISFIVGALTFGTATNTVSKYDIKFDSSGRGYMYKKSNGNYLGEFIGFLLRYPFVVFLSWLMTLLVI